LTGDLGGHHWEALRTLLPLYQAVTSVSIGNGQQTSFWYDAWANDEALVDRFPYLFSHCVKKNLSVAQVMADGLDNPGFLVRRLSAQANDQLDELRELLLHVELQSEPDVRSGPFCLPNGKFDSGGLYRLLKSRDGIVLPSAAFVWESRAPKRVQFFVWLLMQGRIQCRTNLLKKKVVDSATCEVCTSDDESAIHVIFECPFAKAFWISIGFQQFPANIADLHCIQRPIEVPQKFFSTFIALCCWQLWKRRNGVIFRDEAASRRQVLAACVADAQLWKLRLPKKDAATADHWAGVFRSSML
jgi:hypothetical protein